MKTLLSRVLPNDISEYIYQIMRNEYYNKVIIGKIYMLEIILRNYNINYNTPSGINLDNLYIETNIIKNIEKNINTIYTFDKMLIYEDTILFNLIKWYIEIIKYHNKIKNNKFLSSIKYDYDFWCKDYESIYNKSIIP
jgi:Na+-transporting NADH:ubiquinone oxidoreductase subunit NqrE